MWGFVSISIAFLAMAVIAFTDLKNPVMGFSPAELAGLLSFGALIFALLGRVFGRIRQSEPWFKSATIALLIALVPVVLYMRRDDLVASLDSYIGEIQPGRVVVNQAGEAIAAKRRNGGFTLLGTVNGYETRFVFDTGATTVVLMSETAKALGIDSDDIEFTQPVYTANGRTLAARHMIATISVGSITEHNVHALIAQKGALTENLLGMSFLDRLASYEVRGNRLILRGNRQP